MALSTARYEDLIDVPRKLWDPTEGVPPFHGERELFEIIGVEVHWTGSGGDLLDHLDTDDELLAFERYHEVTKGWRDLFYNTAGDSQELIYEGRDITVPSQGNLRNWLTHLVVVGPDQEDAIRGSLRDVFARSIYRVWGAVDPNRKPETLRTHGERPGASTGCPGSQLALIVRDLRAGWIPEGAEMAEHTHTYQNLADFPDAKQAKTKNFWDGSDPTLAASRSVVAVIANRVDNDARKRDGEQQAAIRELSSRLAQAEQALADLSQVGNTIEIDDEALALIVSEIQRRLES